MDLSGRVAAITGASSGIGLAVAQHLAREGVAVAIAARRADRLDEAVRDIRASGGRAEAVVADVTSEGDVQRLVHHARTTFGRLDIMICNAGFGYYGTVEETPTPIMQRMMDVNFMGTFYGARAALPHFRAQGRGHLIIVSSIVGQRGIALMSGYSATKAAQVGFAESLRTEFNGTRIAVSVVLPVSTDTEFHVVMQETCGVASRARGPRQTAEQVAEAIARGVAHPTPEIYPYRKARGLVLLNAIAPGFCDRFVKRFGRQAVTR